METKKYYKICPTCTYFCHIDEEDEYCAHCGTELISTCPECGKKINYPHGSYCKYCGAKIREMETVKKAFKDRPEEGRRF